MLSMTNQATQNKLFIDFHHNFSKIFKLVGYIQLSVVTLCLLRSLGCYKCINLERRVEDKRQINKDKNILKVRICKGEPKAHSMILDFHMNMKY
jgi:hypothetical protein